MKSASCILLFVFFAHNAYGASFDCTKAAYLDEKAICASSGLSKAEDALASYYMNALRIDRLSAVATAKSSVLRRRKCTSDALCIAKVLESEQSSLAEIVNGKPSEVESIPTNASVASSVKTAAVGNKNPTCLVKEAQPIAEPYNGEIWMRGLRVQPGLVWESGDLKIRVNSQSGNDYNVDLKTPDYNGSWVMRENDVVKFNACSREISMSIVHKYGYGYYFTISLF